MVAAQPVLFIAGAYPPENVIGALRPARFVRYLPAFGFEPWVITSSPQPVAQPRVRNVPFSFGLRERVLNRTWFPYDERLTWAGPAAAAAEQLLDQHPIRIVFSTSPPIGAHLAAARLKKKRGLRWVADFRDPIVGNFDRTAWGARQADPYMERYIGRWLDMAILNTGASAEKWKARYPHLTSRIYTIPNGFDPADELAALPLPARPASEWLHAGSLYVTRYPARLFPALDRLRQSGRLAPLRVRLIGYINPELFAIPAYQHLLAAGWIDCTPEHIPQAAARKAMAEANRLIVFDHYHAEGNVQIPAKIFDYVRVGRPVLAFTTPGAPLDRLLAGSGIDSTRIYEEDGQEEIESKLLAFAARSDEARPASESFGQEFNGREQARKLADLFRTLL